MRVTAISVAMLLGYSGSAAADGTPFDIDQMIECAAVDHAFMAVQRGILDNGSDLTDENRRMLTSHLQMSADLYSRYVWHIAEARRCDGSSNAIYLEIGLHAERLIEEMAAQGGVEDRFDYGTFREPLEALGEQRVALFGEDLLAAVPWGAELLALDRFYDGGGMPCGWEPPE